MQGYLPGLFSMLQGGAQTPWQQLQASRQQQNTGLLGLLGRQETSPGLYHGMGQGSLYYQPWMNRDNWPATGATGGPAAPVAASTASAAGMGAGGIAGPASGAAGPLGAYPRSLRSLLQQLRSEGNYGTTMDYVRNNGLLGNRSEMMAYLNAQAPTPRNYYDPMYQGLGRPMYGL